MADKETHRDQTTSSFHSSREDEPRQVLQEHIDDERALSRSSAAK